MTTDEKITINNAALAKALGLAPGATVTVRGKNGVPITREWRNRIKDSKIDGCVTIAQTSTKKTKSTKGDK